MADDNSANQPDDGTTVPRIKLGEQGIIGLKTASGRIIEEAQVAFRYPHFLKTVNEMRNNPTVGAAMNVYRMMISRVKWYVEPPADATEQDKKRAKIVQTMMHDMEHSWPAFIESVIPYLEYGFAINELVLRRRLPRNGSKYKDNLVGLRKLPTRSQDTIRKWNFSDDGAELLSVEQTLQGIENSWRFSSRTKGTDSLTIDREKFLLFSASATRGNPEGNSLYKNIYLAYKMLSVLQEQELIGVAKDIQGIMKIGIPPAYLSPTASDNEKATASAFQTIIDNYNAGTQKGILVPVMYDDKGQSLFTYELMEAKGSAKYDVEAIIKRLQQDILSALNVDILKLGSDGTGSFSLASAKTSVLAIAIDYRLREIAEVLNSSLMRTIYEQNGWSAENLPTFQYEDIEDADVESMGKFIQQVFSVSAIEVDRPVMNRVRKIFGVAPLPNDEPVNKENLPAVMTGTETNAGEGMKTAGDGTSKSPMGAKDSSAANNNNK